MNYLELILAIFACAIGTTASVILIQDRNVWAPVVVGWSTIQIMMTIGLMIDGIE